MGGIGGLISLPKLANLHKGVLNMVICIIITAIGDHVYATTMKEKNIVYLCTTTDSNISVSHAFAVQDNFLIQSIFIHYAGFRHGLIRLVAVVWTLS